MQDREDGAKIRGGSMSAAQSHSVDPPALQAGSVYPQSLIRGMNKGVTCSSNREEK